MEIIKYEKLPRCLHNRLRKISLQHLKRHIPFQAAVGLHSIVEIHKAAQLFLPMLRTVKLLLFVPHFHNCLYHSLSFAVSLRTVNPQVAGSSPARGAKFMPSKQSFRRFSFIRRLPLLFSCVQIVSNTSA